MTKALLNGLMLSALAIAGWHYAPPQMRDSLLGLVGMASRRDTAQIRRVIGDAVLPEDPITRRAVLAQDIQRSIRELQRRAITETRGADAALAAGLGEDQELAGKTSAEILAGAGNAVAALEGANKDTSVGMKITERILERILPGAACRE
ncbi:MAG: hypothetical protein A3J10_04295 [Candidatus Sungbacteria bacterium RIFCSPLOWO2_02_FULL_54_10]|uniref:DUF5667 domain-containing protein n=2 Tax=Candidatus Sungiibacteriota TaxID=1817917 RepID=A0A1G2L574_9BACT|nr:MAG: hypothetical protein A2679_02435 [Candidatus Sungbacteria bacterium RIFCSPHIGHO2_01_FULL_54_26]OHA03747.1 MAG: hypothetical protein A3C92_00085 [Candidatus Sungbacteria bacterium RIFCSPHIGHO2_02_FULL_53_17]OHA06827.1 MAG: hypothetical protein A3B34_02680 [Candidatus Sungbacteria bacterium RIFCSPLOWO2_01_FULL_54_21]OHA13086.1 MAG: hypothetical protein A3J10_04295 [Candidatus Sungbacteria bacterium RIFCSPLOWO2_02_FULL_54_10]